MLNSRPGDAYQGSTGVNCVHFLRPLFVLGLTAATNGRVSGRPWLCALSLSLSQGVTPACGRPQWLRKLTCNSCKLVCNLSAPGRRRIPSRHVPFFPVGASFRGAFPRVRWAARVSGSLLQKSALRSSVAFYSAAVWSSSL